MIKVQVDKIWLGKVSVRDYIYKNEGYQIFSSPFLVKKCVGSLTDFFPRTNQSQEQYVRRN